MIETANTQKMKSESPPTLWVVVPAYNEEAVLPKTLPRFLEEIKTLENHEKISADSRILFVDDGSNDRTWELIERASQEDAHVFGIAQSTNRGHQNAVLTGLMVAKDQCDIMISIDCDGQDDIEAMEEMVDAYSQGNEVVYGARASRTEDHFFKRTTAQLYYRFLKRMGVQVIYNHADYRLASSKVLKHLADYHEVNLFLRGLFPLIGFKSTIVYYNREKRIAGKSHYPLKKMVHLAIDGITSLSIKPLTAILKAGCVSTLVFAIALGFALKMHWMLAGLLCAVFLTGGIQLIGIGVIGGYVGKIYQEVKHRPRYIISRQTDQLKEKLANEREE